MVLMATHSSAKLSMKSAICSLVISGFGPLPGPWPIMGDFTSSGWRISEMSTSAHSEHIMPPRARQLWAWTRSTSWTK